MDDDEDTAKRAVVHEIGETLDALSIEELHARIEMLENEIVRLRDAISDKSATRSAAEAFFKS